MASPKKKTTQKAINSALWHQCVRGHVAFVEDDARYEGLAPANVVTHAFRSKVGSWARVPSPPSAIHKPWDYVLVDGPRGYDATCPGRQISVAWAARLARRAIFVHDYERPWERVVCDRYLGGPSGLIRDTEDPARTLAVFRREAFFDFC